ncbi:hypothetical protein GCM10010187_05070 [Actinomadura coerulea]|nr:hypothetical protein GCM10010187_05070 [Actinomadura coerulea]
MAEPLRMVVPAAYAGATPAARTASAAVPTIAVCLIRATGDSSVRFGVGIRESNSHKTRGQWRTADCRLAGSGHQPVSAGKAACPGAGKVFVTRPLLDGPAFRPFPCWVRTGTARGKVG